MQNTTTKAPKSQKPEYVATITNKQAATKQLYSVEGQLDIPKTNNITLNLEIVEQNRASLPQANKDVTGLGFWEELPEPGQEILTTLPDFSGLILLNANTIQQDGFFSYIGNKEDCFLAAQNKERVFIKGNPTTGYKLYLLFEPSNSKSPKFNPRSFARDSVIFRIYTLASLLGWPNDELSFFLQTRFDVRWVECLSPQQIKVLIKQFSCICQTKQLTRSYAA